MDAPVMDTAQLQRQVAGLSTLVSLQSRVQDSATLKEARYRAVNETALLVPYSQALLFGPEFKTQAVSDLPQPDPNAPFILWTGRLAAHLGPRMQATGRVDPSSLPRDISDEWDQWLPAHALWMVLEHTRHGVQGAMLLVRDKPFTDEEIALCSHLSRSYGNALGGFVRPASALREKTSRMLRRRRLMLVLAAALLLAGLVIPVHLTGVGTAEVVAKDPAMVRSPLDGVVSRVLVLPNQRVTPGQPLVALDDRDLSSRLVLARQALATAQAELRQVSQSALVDSESKWHLSMAQAVVEQRREELAHIEDLLGRTEIASPREGVAIYNDPDELVGVPVRLGQKLMAVCGEHESRLRLWLPVDQAVELEPGAEVLLYLNVDPDQAITARIDSAGFTAELSPDGVPSYRILAEFADQADRPRIGLRGLGVVSGEQVPLLYSLLRKPYAALRRWIGW